MAQWLRQSTEITRRIGPYVDKADAVTEETGLAGAGTELSKAGGAFATGPTLGTHDAEGWYPVTLTTSHTDTLGSLTIKAHDSATHLPVWAEFLVVPATVFDAMVNGTDALDVNTIQLAGTTQTARDIGASVLISSGTGTGQILTAGGIVTADLGAVNGNSVNDNGAGAISAVLANNAAHGGLSASLVVSQMTSLGNMTFANIAATGNITTGGAVVSTLTADAVWDELLSGHTDSGSAGEAMAAAGTAGDPWTTAIPGAYGAGTAGKLLGDNIDAAISSRGIYDGGDITGNVSGSVGSVTGAVGSVTGNVGGSVAGNVSGSVASVTGNVGGIAGTITTLDALDTAQDTQHAATISAIGNLADISVADILTTQMTESYAADGAAPTLAQALCLIQQSLGDFSISGTTITVRKLDGSTTAATFTLDDATTPTSTTRST